MFNGATTQQKSLGCVVTSRCCVLTLGYCAVGKMLNSALPFIALTIVDIYLNQKKFQKTKSASSIILRLLQSGRISEAAERAINIDQCRLAILISETSNEAKALCFEQLTQWKNIGADIFINEQLLAIYMILGGQLDIKKSNGREINVGKGLEWKETLGLHLWYVLG